MFLTPGINGALDPRFSKVEITENNITTTEKNEYLARKLKTGLQIGFDTERIILEEVSITY